MVNQVNDGLDVLKTKAIMIGEQIDRQEVAIGELGIEVDKAHDGLVTSNARLKKILYTVRIVVLFVINELIVQKAFKVLLRCHHDLVLVGFDRCNHKTGYPKVITLLSG